LGLKRRSVEEGIENGITCVEVMGETVGTWDRVEGQRGSWLGEGEHVGWARQRRDSSAELKSVIDYLRELVNGGDHSFGG
jgi:hypothetical protein